MAGGFRVAGRGMLELREWGAEPAEGTGLSIDVALTWRAPLSAAPEMPHTTHNEANSARIWRFGPKKADGYWYGTVLELVIRLSSTCPESPCRKRPVLIGPRLRSFPRHSLEMIDERIQAIVDPSNFGSDQPRNSIAFIAS